jgi:photosystem II stability/assembly factor-like uncharacterized protein
MNRRRVRALVWLVAAFIVTVAVAQAAQKSKSKSNPKQEEPATSMATAPTSPVNPTPPEHDKWLPKQMKWRAVGPANMGGRIADFAVDPKSPYTIFVATATGGLLKSKDNGTTWAGVFEHESVASTGAVAIAPSDSKIVWLGTGEPNGRNSSSWGNGIYKSTDSGATWTNMGLKDSQDIARIAIDPSDPNVVYVAVLGHLWGPNKERGVYKTTDGGHTWTPSLQIDENVGASDLVMDPSDRNTLYAAMYYRRRSPYSFTSGGPIGGIYKTSDAGKTWKKLAGGLPSQTGRIGLDIYRKNSQVVYAVAESDVGGSSSIFDNKSKSGGVFRSEDKGETWQRLNGVDPRAFYFSQIRVDPKDDKRIYVLGFSLHVSDDGGKTFRDDGAKNVHPDLHAMWIDPDNPNRLLLGTDGGIYASYDRSETWQHFENVGIGEFYRVAVDMQKPYRIAGGLQDNFSWIGPSATHNQDGITDADWISLGGGDGMYCAIDPTEPDIIYSESQNGTLSRLNMKTGQRKNLQPAPKEGEAAFRFNWTSPFWISHFDHTVLYLGCNHVFKLTDRGDKWESISPDLSTQDLQKVSTVGSGAETYGTVYTISESPITRGLIWAGTDDGKVWVTRDEGKNWVDLTANFPPEVKGFWVSRVEASHFDEGTAYVAIDGHRNDAYAPFVFVTADFGKTWKSIASDIPKDSPVKVVREDLKNKNLLFAGTEFGFYVSFDRGGHWSKYNSGLPTVAVDDILIHPRDLDLVIGTHGRSIFVMDDIRPLEELTPEVEASELHLFSMRSALEFYYLPEGAISGSGNFKTPNPPFGADINFYVRSFSAESYSVTIDDSTGHTVKKFSGAALPGINRLIWNLQPDRPAGEDLPPDEGQPSFVKPGEYTVTVSIGEKKETGKLTVEAMDGLKIDD